ncbi:hypothetical protein A2U01_0068878 [Trifolium medium]|uniref:Uncharacterized protein n=1 Tax=Trifolium medium TaxID=97028 RepID=A0A392SIG1_9FABA|nr:hypothetical protein [Trifolium medium]
MARCAVDAEEVLNYFCQLRAAQERMARRASLLEDCIRNFWLLARCAASSGASHTFIVHRARRAYQLARRAGAKSI